MFILINISVNECVQNFEKFLACNVDNDFGVLWHTLSDCALCLEKGIV